MPTRTGQDRAGAENNFQVERAAQGDEKGSVSPTIDRVLANGDRGRRRRERERERESLSARKSALYEPGTRAIRRGLFFHFPVFSSLLRFISWLHYFSLFTLPFIQDGFIWARLKMNTYSYQAGQRVTAFP